MKIIPYVIFSVAGFLSGGVMYGEIIPALFCRKNIREIADDKNPGATNVFKHCGKALGTLCLVLDISKAFIPVLLASLFIPSVSFMFSLIIVAPVLGHATGVLNKLHGGKCISASFGVTLGLIPLSFYGISMLISLYIIFSTVLKINPHRKRSIAVFTLFGIAAGALYFIRKEFPLALGCAAVAVTVIIKHLYAADKGIKRN